MEETKFLGLYFDRKLTFLSHIKYVNNKCLKALDILRVIAHLDWYRGSVVVERSPGMRWVGGSIPGRVKQKTLKFEVLMLCLVTL